MLDGSANRAPELVLSVKAAVRRKEVARVEIGVPKKLEAASMDFIGSCLRHYINNATAVVAEFGVEIIGQDAELGNRVEIGHNRSAAIHQLLYISSVYHVPVGIFPLAADGLVARVENTGRRNRYRRSRHHDRVGQLSRDRNDAGLEGQKVGETSSVEGNRGHLSP